MNLVDTTTVTISLRGIDLVALKKLSLVSHALAVAFSERSSSASQEQSCLAGVLDDVIRKIELAAAKQGVAVLTDAPQRIQLRRAKGWRMPPNTVKVDRTTKWGNPFVTGRDGTQAECVDLYCKMLKGLICISGGPSYDEQITARHYALDNVESLRGKHVACWCAKEPCHGSVLLLLANAQSKVAT